MARLSGSLADDRIRLGPSHSGRMVAGRALSHRAWKLVAPRGIAPDLEFMFRVPGRSADRFSFECDHLLVGGRRATQRELLSQVPGAGTIVGATPTTRNAAREPARAGQAERAADATTHFLFNTLNAIVVLVRQHKVEQADEMLTNLSELLRQTLAGWETQEAAGRKRGPAWRVEEFRAGQDRIEILFEGLDSGATGLR